jgi:HEPN domain-containing protein
MDLANLLTLLEKAELAIPEPVREAGRLTRFAVVTRYPGITEPVTEEEYQAAVSIAATVVAWAEQHIKDEADT